MPLRSILTNACCLLFLLTCSHCSKNSTDPPPGNNGPDTTSHNFVWQVDTLGPLSTCLNDVAFISDTEAWAVGRISYGDSAGQSFSYGLARRTGERWSFDRIDSAPNNALVDIRGIHIFDIDNNWLAVGSIYHWTGGPYAPLSWLRNTTTTELALNVWGDAGDRIIAVGTQGLLLSFDGSSWMRYSTAGSAILKDVYGKPGGGDVWTCGYSVNPGDGILLHFDNSNWNTIWRSDQPGTSPYSGSLESLWYSNNDSLIIVGSSGVFWQDIHGKSVPRKDSISLGKYPFRVRGNAANDIFIACSGGRIWHYNGKSWQNYPQLENEDFVFSSITVKGDMVIAVGRDFSQGVQRLLIVSGYRISK